MWKEQPTPQELLDHRLGRGWQPTPSDLQDGQQILGYASCLVNPK